MTQNNPQVPWTDEQWDRIDKAIQEEANRARVAATFLSQYGPLPSETDFVRAENIPYDQPLRIEDTKTIQLATLQIKVRIRSAQMADPEMTSVLALFRRAANVLARLEDAVVFRGLKWKGRGAGSGVEPAGGVSGLPPIWEIKGGEEMSGLWKDNDSNAIGTSAAGQALVAAVSKAIGNLEDSGHFGPFATVLGQQLFLIAQTPDNKSLVLPQDRIIPFLGGGPLLRSSTLDAQNGYVGVVVALGGLPVEFIVATDMSLQFLQVTEEPAFLFRVREKIALRIKEAQAIVRLHLAEPTVSKVEPAEGPSAGSTATDRIAVVITGENFLGATAVQFGTKAVPCRVDSDYQITAMLPQHLAGKVHVKVRTPGGLSTPTSADEFTYIAAPPAQSAETSSPTG
jgi:uncharacterized linocin/CFP29 family protein